MTEIYGISQLHEMGMCHKCCQMSLRRVHVQQANLLRENCKNCWPESPSLSLFLLLKSNGIVTSQHGVSGPVGTVASAGMWCRVGARLYAARVKVGVDACYCRHGLNLAGNPSR